MSERPTLESNHDSPQPSAGLKRLRRILASVLLVAGTIALGLVTGALLADLIRSSSVKTILGVVPLKWGLAGIGVTFLIGALENVLKLANTFREYIARPDKKISVYPDCVSLASIVAYVTTIALVPLEPTEPANDNAPEVIFLSPPARNAEDPVAYFPFLFTDLALSSDTLRGTSLDSLQKQSVARLVRSLRACAGPKSNEAVILDVRGYADANEFPSNSIELNRQAANRRGRALHDEIVRVLESASLPASISVRGFTEWSKSDPLAMTRERYFQARKLIVTGRENDQGLFNRRADMLVLKIGACEPLR